MKQYIKFDPKNKALGIKTDCKLQGRHVVMGGTTKVTTQTAKKTKKGCADLLKTDDEWAKEHDGEGFLSESQRSDLADFAGDAYRTKPKAPVDPLKKSRGESKEAYAERLRKLLNGD